MLLPSVRLEEPPTFTSLQPFLHASDVDHRIPPRSRR
jgi:hypothetical protein